MADSTFEALEKWVRDIIWKAMADWINAAIDSANEKLNALIREKLTAHMTLATSPVLVQITEKRLDSFVFLVRGNVPIGDAFSMYARLEVEVPIDIHLENLPLPPVTIKQWNAVACDLHLGQNPITETVLALAYVDGQWSGRGKLQFKYWGFGLDVFLGGLTDRGAMIGIGVNSMPAPVPLGMTGLALRSTYGELAYNFKPRLFNRTTNPTAMDYALWAGATGSDRWEAAAPSETTIGVGVACGIGTLFDNGFMLALAPVGFCVLAPGLVFVIGGEGRVLNTQFMKCSGYLAVDVPSGSLALGLALSANMPAQSGDLFNASGTLDAFFSVTDPAAWYINLGTDQAPIRAEAFGKMIRVALFLMINNSAVAFGIAASLGVSYGVPNKEGKKPVIGVVARVGVAVAARIGWNPVELRGWFEIFLQFGVFLWKFKFMLTGKILVEGNTPHPQRIKGEVVLILSLPWPLPDIPIHSTYERAEIGGVSATPFVDPLMIEKVVLE